MSNPSPFVVFSLPRSRSFWCATWFHRVLAGGPVGHDLGLTCDTVEQMLAWLHYPGTGTFETGAAEYWPILRRAVPGARIAILHRQIDRVIGSLERLGVEGPAIQRELMDQAGALESLRAEPGVLTLNWTDLSDPRKAEELLNHCLPGVPFDYHLWKSTEAENIQVNWPERAQLMLDRVEATNALYREGLEWLSSPRPFLWFGFQPMGQVLDEISPWLVNYCMEARQAVEGLPELNLEILQELERQQMLWVQVARQDGRLVAFATWHREVNVENKNASPAVSMGSLYSPPEYRGLRLGERMLKLAAMTFGAMGFDRMRLHHTVWGRGARLGTLFTRMGAEEWQREYVLKLKGPPNA